MNLRKTLIPCVLAVSAAATACGQQDRAGAAPARAPAEAASATASEPESEPDARTAASPPGAPAPATGKAEIRTAAASDAGGAALYVVKEGNKVDKKTLLGWRTWRALACERCHGAAQEGLVGPPLVESMKKLSKEEFHKTLMEGRPEKGMPPFSASKMVNDNWEGLYGYLKGRSDGKIKPGHVYPLE